MTINVKVANAFGLIRGLSDCRCLLFFCLSELAHKSSLVTVSVSTLGEVLAAMGASVGPKATVSADVV